MLHAMLSHLQIRQSSAWNQSHPPIARPLNRAVSLLNFLAYLLPPDMVLTRVQPLLLPNEVIGMIRQHPACRGG